MKNVPFRFLSIVLILFVLASCVNNSPIKEKTMASKVEVPYWVDSPKLNGYVAVTGSAMPQKIGGLEGQRRAAVLRARAQLAKEVRVYVQKSLLINQDSSTREPEVAQKIKTQAIELQQLERATIRDEWINNETGELFIWFVAPVN